MKIGFIADTHVGNHKVHGGKMVGGINERAVLCLDVIRNAVGVAQQLKVERLVVAGDVFDIATPSPTMVYATGQAFKAVIPVHFVLGNHDRSSDSDNHNALAPFFVRPGFINETIQPQIDVWPNMSFQMLYVPFQGGKGDSWLTSAVGHHIPPDNDIPTVVVTHAGLRDGSEPPWLAQANDAINCRAFAKKFKGRNIHTLVAGNWHFRKRFGFEDIEFFQLGALVPTGYDNEGFQNLGTLAIFDTDEMRWSVYEIPGPRFIKCKGVPPVSFLDKLDLHSRDRHKVFLRIECTVEEHYEAEKVLEHHNFEPEAVQYKVVSKDMKKAARKAANVARKAETLDGALASYINALELADGEAEEVRTLCKEYLDG